MNLTRLIQRSLAHHWRMNVAVMIGVAAATAVLTGALIVGDSVRGSLRRLTLDRLGEIDELLVTDRLFRQSLTQEVADHLGFSADFDQAVPALLFPHATIERSQGRSTTRAGSVFVIGADERFWNLESRAAPAPRIPAGREVVVNQSLADELQVKVGDQVTLRLPRSSQVPADSPLASKNDRIRGLVNWKIIDILPSEGLGRFSLTPSQKPPRNVWVALSTLQEELDEPGRINAMFVSGRSSPPSSSAREKLQQMLVPSLADFGVHVKHVKRGFRRDGAPEKIVVDYFTVTTDRLFFSPEMGARVQRVIEPMGGQPVLTYLADSIREITPAGRPAEHPGVPYSMITAIDTTDQFALTDRAGQPIGPLADDEIVLNEWAADDLGVEAGERIRVSFFEPESTHGEAVERSADFRLKAVAKLVRPARPFRKGRPAAFDQPPTAANDPDLTPEVKGVTDQETIDDWDAPFPFDYRRVRKNVDEKYWEEHRTTPKAFVSIAVGRRLWRSRFGESTSFRIPNREGLTADKLEAQLQAELSRSTAELGFQFTPIKARQLSASRGTTPFDALFLALSFFVIAAALMMVALLYRLGIERRSAEIGTLLAMGFMRRRVLRVMVLEGSVLALFGAAGGLAVAIGYAWLMLTGLTHWWQGAIGTPFLQFHMTARSLATGYGLGVVTSAATIAWTIWRTRHFSVRRLLAGRLADETSRGIPGAGSARGGRRWSRWLPAASVLVAIALSVAATRLGGMAQAGAFVAGGAALLFGLLLEIRIRLRQDRPGDPGNWTRGAVMWRLALRNATRNSGRSAITIGLVATASFLIVAMSSFRMAPTARGTGGFQLLAESSQPVYVDLNSEARRQELFGPNSTLLAGSSVLGLRLRGGDDASCQNLYQSTQPRVIGVTPQFIDHFENRSDASFQWSGSAAVEAGEAANPWRLLGGDAVESNQPVPVVLDKNTAMYSLHLYGGIGEEFEFEYDGQPIRFRVAGLLENSLLQGSLLIGEADFRARFPTLSGYRFFLIDTPRAKSGDVAALLEDRFGDEGFDATGTEQILAELLAVQNTYLSTFQSLGALGLLLGTFGLATVQVRNVLERRGELAVLRASGYRRRRIANLVMSENLVLLFSGLAAGVLAAVLVVLPHKVFGDAAVSWSTLRDLALMLAGVLVAGILSSFAGVWAVARLPLVEGIRGD